jgi:hypothetical protein
MVLIQVYGCLCYFGIKSVLLDVTQCTPVKVKGRSGGTGRIHLQVLRVS